MDIKEMIGKIDSASEDLKSLITVANDYAEMHDNVEEVHHLSILLEKMTEHIDNLHEIAQENLSNTTKL